MFDIPKLNSITYRQILEQAQTRAFTESGGKLNDFSRHNPLYVLVSSLAWTGTEILYYANKFAERLAYTYLSLLSGSTDVSGSKAACTLEITLNSLALLEIPKGAKVQGEFLGQTLIFETSEALLFDGTVLVNSVRCIAIDFGSAYTIPTGILNRFTQPLSFIESITNVTPAVGVDPTTRDELTKVALERLRSRALVSENDFIFYVTQYAGKGSVCSVIPNLSGDLSRFEIGSVHIFVLDNELNPASVALLEQIKTEIYTNNPPMIATNLYFSPMQVLEIKIDIQIKIDTTVTAFQISEEIYKQLEIYLNPENHKPGDEFNLRLFESRLWLIPGIITFEPIRVNGANINISSDKRTKIVPQYVSSQIVDIDNNVVEILIGAGESVYEIESN